MRRKDPRNRSWLSLEAVTRDMERPRRRNVAFLLRVRIYDGDPSRPKFHLSIPLPLVFFLALGLELMFCVLVHLVSPLLLWRRRRHGGYVFVKQLALVRVLSRRLFLTRLCYVLMRRGGGLGLRVLDGAEGMMIYA